MQRFWSWLEGFGPKVLVSMLFRLECHVDQRHWVCAFPGVSLPTLLPTIAHVFTSATDGYALTVSSRPQSSSYPERVKSFEALYLLSEKSPIKKRFRLTHSSSKQRLAQHTYPTLAVAKHTRTFPKATKEHKLLQIQNAHNQTKSPAPTNKQNANPVPCLLGLLRLQRATYWLRKLFGIGSKEEAEEEEEE